MQMNVGILKRYILNAEAFWLTAFSTKLSVSSSASLYERGAHTLASVPSVKSQLTTLSETEIESLSKSDRKILDYLNTMISNSPNCRTFSSDELLMIGKLSLSRLQDSLVCAFSQMNPDYQKKVFCIYSSMYKQVGWALCYSIRASVSEEILKFPIENAPISMRTQNLALAPKGMSILKTPSSSAPDISSSLSFFARTQSAVNLGGSLSSSRQYKPGSGFPELKRATQELHGVKDPKKGIARFNHALVESLLTLSPGDPRQETYRRLEYSIREKNRILFALETKKVERSEKMDENHTFRLSHLDHFIAMLDCDNTCLLSGITRQEFDMLKRNLVKFKTPDGLSLSSLGFEAARRVAFDSVSYQSLKTELQHLSNKGSKIPQSEKSKLKTFLDARLPSIRASYLIERLKTSFRERLGNRFLVTLEDEFRCIFSSYIDPEFIKKISFNIRRRMLFAEDSYASLFCEKIFNSSLLLSTDVKTQIMQECLAKENELRLVYSNIYTEFCQLIPARLEFEMTYMRALKELRDHIFEGYHPLTSSESKRFESQRDALRKELKLSLVEKFSLDPREFRELKLDDLRSILEVIKRREVDLRALWVVSESESISFHPTHYPHDPFNLYYIKFCKLIVHSINIRYMTARDSQLDLIQGMFSVDNTECPNMAYAKQLGFTYPDLMVKQSMVEFSQFCKTDALSGIEFVVPELMAIYLNGDTFYTILGLLLVNGTKLSKEVLQGRNYLTLDIPNVKEFRLLKTLDKDGEFRALTILEIGSFWMQEYRVTSTRATSSFPLWVRGDSPIKFYHSFQFLLSQLVISSWHELGKPDYLFVLKLIELYLTNDPVLHDGNHELWRQALSLWCDELIYTGEKENKKPRHRADVYTLYGQVIEGEMYMFQLLHRLIKENHLLDDLMLKLTVWYLNKFQDETRFEQDYRLNLLHQVFIKMFDQSNQLGLLYFNCSDTRCEKLARGLEARSKINSHRRFMIPSLISELEPVYLSNIREIPFEDALLSDDGRYIYDLRIVKTHFEQTGQFLNVALDKPFTRKERLRIKANPSYAQYTSHIETREEALRRTQTQTARLSSRMVRELWKLLNETHLLEKEIGYELSLGHSVSHEGITITPSMYARDSSKCDGLMQTIVLKRIDRFIFDYYQKLPDVEKTRLDNYLIFHPDYGKAVPFIDMLRQFADPTFDAKHFCLDKVTEPLFRVVLSYDKVTRFRDWLEIIEHRGKIWLDDLRATTQELEYCDNQNSPVLQKLKVILFRLKISADYSFCQEAEERLLATSPFDSVDNIKMIYDGLKPHVARELTRVSAQVSEQTSSFSLFSSAKAPTELTKKRDALRIVNDSLTSSSALTDDQVPYYDPEFLVSALTRCLKAWDPQDIPPTLRQTYRELLIMSASKIAFFYSRLTDKRNTPDFLRDLIQKYKDRGVDITSQEAIKVRPSHMIDVTMNVRWQRFLQSLDESLRTRLENYLNRQATHANSFGL